MLDNLLTLNSNSLNDKFENFVHSCTVAFWNTIPEKLIGRNMDWHSDFEAELYVLPRGLKRNGMAGNNSIDWVSKYGSTIVFYMAPADGINEKGLAAHLLWLAESDYGTPDEKSNKLSVSLWLQYYLDNFSSVKEAVEFTENSNFQISGMNFEGIKVGIHLYLDDESGDAAIIEYVNGKPIIHHGKENTVMTNSPLYDKQLENLKNYKTFGGIKEIPGSTEATDRFVRTKYYLDMLPDTLNLKSRVAALFSVIRNAAQPFRKSFNPSKPEVSVTRWRTVIDFTNQIYFFEATDSPNIVWLEMKKLNFEEGADIMTVKVKPNNYIGDITNKLEKSEIYKLPL